VLLRVIFSASRRLFSGKKTLRLYFQSRRDLTDRFNRRINPAGLKPADIGLVDIHPRRQLFLRDVRGQPKPLYVRAKDFLNIHL